MARLASGLIPKSSAMKNTSLPFMFDVDSAAMFGSTQFLITGGTGFIGRHVVHRLLAQGAGVRVFCRTPEKAQRLFGDRVGIARGDLRDRASVVAAMRGCGAVIPLGAAFAFGSCVGRQFGAAARSLPWAQRFILGARCGGSRRKRRCRARDIFWKRAS